MKNNDKLIGAHEALDFLLKNINKPNSTKEVNLDDALGLILAQNVVSNIDVPGFDNSAMDGFAINLKDEQINSNQPIEFLITDRITAGTSGEILKPGCAARIFTGAPIPEGANTVIMQEKCQIIDNKILIKKQITLNKNIRPKGNDIQNGTVILKSGTKLQPQDIALAASVGVNKFQVFNKITVGVFFSGDELVEPGNSLSDSQIFNSNRYALTALLKQLGCKVINLGNIKDDIQTTCEALEKLANTCDLIITTGGVSVGEEDHIKPAVEKLGKLSLWSVCIKPGKPLAFGSIGTAIFMGLPGNPVSAMVTFLLFARPLIKKMQGTNNFKNHSMKVSCGFDWLKIKHRREFVRVQLDYATTPPTANLYPKQGSDVLSSMVWADGLLEMPENNTFKRGDILNFYSLYRLVR